MRTGTLIVLAACGGLLAACGGGAEENATLNIDENAGVLADNGVLPIDDVTANDTLGNDTLGNDTTDINAADNAAADTANTTNSY